jgi:pyridinium-3,5-bisthiocarboxylic acid mononucleotide nickel chelatase
VLCETGKVDTLVDTLFQNTSTFGVRTYEVRRQKLQRFSQTVETPFGPIAVKIGQWRGQVVQISPEYESCRQAARHCGVPLQEIYHAAEAQARMHLGTRR